MKITVKIAEIAKEKTDMVVFGLFEDDKDLPMAIKSLGKEIVDNIEELVKQKQIKTKHNSAYSFLSLGKVPATSILIIGLGKKADFTLEKLRLVGGTIAKVAKEKSSKTIAVDFNTLTISCHSGEVKPSPESDPGQARMTLFSGSASLVNLSQALSEGLILGDYEFKEYKTESEDDSKADIENIDLISNDKNTISEINVGINQAIIGAEAVKFARDLVNQPSSSVHPLALKKAAEKIAAESSGTVKVKSFNREDLKKMGAGAILGVASGSEFEPYLIHLEYSPSGAKKSVAIVGKGVTFDSGGLSLKPSKALEDMKSDMAGAATVLGVFYALKTLKPNICVHGVIPCVENMPSGQSMRVGDVLKTLSGKTVEVLNTDAEGRLILADALTYAQKQKTDVVVDFATLTGACMVALGEQIAGMMGDEEVVKQLEIAGKESGESVWELPLVEEYKEKMKSEVADLSNVHKGRYAGAIMGGLFLKEFIKDTPWAHVDIAGPSFNRSSLNSYSPSGGTGFGVRLALNWLSSF